MSNKTSNNYNQKNQNGQKESQAPNFPGYYKNGNFNGEIFSYAEDLSNYWDYKKIKFTKSQIRNIYNEVKYIERIYKRNKTDALIRLNILKAKIKYNEARESNKLEKEIGEEIIKWIEGIKDFNKDFDLFCKLFEAVVGFSYQYAKKN